MYSFSWILIHIYSFKAAHGKAFTAKHSNNNKNKGSEEKKNRQKQNINRNPINARGIGTNHESSD